jgi:hypothetical protein
MNNRISCIVPFCRRTAPAEKYDGCEIICARHWRSISRDTRAFKAYAERRHRKLFRRWQKAVTAGDDVTALRLAHILDKTFATCNRAWARCRREAIEAAVGIA